MAIESLGGYRIVRKVGEGPRAELLLAHPDRDDPAAVPAVIKLYRAGVDDESIIGEIEALSRAAGDHVVELLDVTAAPGGSPALILQRLPSGTLARLLAERTTLRAGEAITILAPLVSAIERMHASGVTHGAIRADAVVFDGAGAPVLACFGGAALIEVGMPVARLDAEPGVATDLLAFAALAGGVLGRVPEVQVAAVRDWIAEEVPAQGWGEAFADRLFELGDPEPVDLSTRGDPAVPALPGRLVTVRPAGDMPAAEPEPRPGLLSSLGLPAWAEELIPSRAPDLIRRVRAALSVVRARVWVAAGAVLVALIAALFLVPGLEPDASAVPSAPPTAPPVDRGPVGGDDPVAAVLALVEARELCIRDLSVLCLDAVGQPGSAALASDQQLVRAVQAGGELPVMLSVDPVNVMLTERLGDSAIVSLGPDSEPASVLLMKGEAGWRIRDYLER